jgi:hypothetical protein
MDKKWILIILGIIGVLYSGGSIIMGGLDAVVEKMATAIKNFEGWAVGSRSYRNNNPGNLKFAGQAGAVGQDEQGHAIFSDYEAGWAALKRQIRLAFTGGSHVYTLADNLYDFFSKYAEGNSRQYAEYVAGQLGVDPFAAKLSDILKSYGG